MAIKTVTGHTISFKFQNCYLNKISTYSMEKFEKNYLVTETLEKFGTDLTKMAQEGKLDPVIGRKKEIENVIQILCKRRKNNPCLIGDPGVGKTMIAEGLAQCISNATVPPNFCATKVFSLDMARLISGTTYRGDFEQRLLKIVDEIKLSKGEIILFIDELHTLVGAGGCGQPLNASNILKPSLARGELKCIGATTIDEYRKYIEKDPALKRRFQLVEVPEPTVDEAILILKGLCHKYSVQHDVRYTDEALEAAVHLSKQYISDRFLPDKAIDLMDEAGSRVCVRQAHKTLGTHFVTETDIRQVLSSWTGIPLETMSDTESTKLLQLELTMSQNIIGQQEAIDAVCRVIRRSRVGLRDPSRPIASLLFTGPTGVGKTEVAKVVASEYFGCKDKGMVRIDMTEYMEKHTLSRLIGSPPGYTGHDEGGQLTEAIRRHPHKLVLFDEIEKAHRDVFNVFLQILDDGRLTDGKGRTIDFRNTVIIMTSNVGGEEDSSANRVAIELKKMFKPEFLNRIDDVIVFKRLGKEEMREIFCNMLDQVETRVLDAKNIVLNVTHGARNKVIEEGFSSCYGARPMRRAVTRLIEDGLAERLLKGEIEGGDTVIVDINSLGNITFSSFSLSSDSCQSD